MKKIIIALIMFGFVFALTSCDFLNNLTTKNSTSDTSTEVTYSSTDSNTISESSTDIITSTLISDDTSTTSVTLITSSTTTTTTEQISTFTTTTESITTTETEIITTTTLEEQTTTSSSESGGLITNAEFDLIQDVLPTVGIPASGEAKVIVFVVDFPDKLITDDAKVLSDTNLAFNGNSEDLVYESLNSYYLKSSYNKLNLSADIFGVYTAKNNSTYYETLNTQFYATDPQTGEYLYPDATHPDSDLIFEILTQYDSQINYSDYDANNDGYIDGVYVIYNHEISYESGSDLWWAYQYYYYYEDSFDGVAPNYYVWSGLDFFYEGEEPLNARTIIHETGHMLGLEDYYDYYPDDFYNSGGLGTFMMDYNVGDHDAFSKLLLGWINPIIIETSATVDILPLASSGDVLLIIDEWKGTIFDEYLLVIYYTPEMLNELDKSYIFTEPGILVFHVSAAIDNGYNTDSYYYSIFNNNNTDSVNKLLKIIEADMGNDIEKYAIAEDTDLFQVGDIFNYNIHSDYSWYDGNNMNFFIEVVSLDVNKATIKIDFLS